MTWEPKGAYDEDFGFATALWYGWRIDKAGSDQFSLTMIDADYDGFDKLEDYQEIERMDPPYDPRKLRAARRAVERVIRKKTDDEGLYIDGAFEISRVRPEHFDLFEGTITSLIPDCRL